MTGRCRKKMTSPRVIEKTWTAADVEMLAPSIAVFKSNFLVWYFLPNTPNLVTYKMSVLLISLDFKYLDPFSKHAVDYFCRGWHDQRESLETRNPGLFLPFQDAPQNSLEDASFSFLCWYVNIYAGLLNQMKINSIQVTPCGSGLFGHFDVSTRFQKWVQPRLRIVV